MSSGYGLSPYGLGPYGDPVPGGLPTVHVYLDDGTGTFPFDLTNMGGVSYVLLADGFTLERGRQDWQGGVTAGTLALTLNNSDGRFTVGSTTIASPSPIKVDARIRVTETVDGSTFTRFTGYVKQWPVAWPATVSTFATVQVVATDAQARAERRVLRSLVAEGVLASTPSAYWPCDEEAGALAAGDSSGNQAAPLTMTGSGAAVTFGSGGADFTGGQYLHVAMTSSPSPLGLLLKRTGAPAAAECVFLGYACELVIETTGKLSLYRTGSLAAQTSTSICDGAQHAVGLYGFAGSGKLTVDGGTVGTFAALGIGVSYPQDLRFGGGGTIATATMSGRLSDITLGAVPVAATVEADTARINRIAGYAGLTVGTMDSSLTNVPVSDTTNQTAWDALQQVAVATFGTLFVDGAGALTFHNRNKVAAKTSPDLTLDASYIRDVQPVHDDQQILNYLEGSSETTKSTQVARNTASEAAHGRYAESSSYLLQTDQEVMDRLNWIVAIFAEPSTRYGTLTIDLYAMTPRTAASVLTALEINCWLQITGLPSQTPGGTTVDLVVEGYSEHVGADVWSVTCNVVSRSLFDALILDDPTLGVLDAGNRLYV